MFLEPRILAQLLTALWLTPALVVAQQTEPPKPADSDSSLSPESKEHAKQLYEQGLAAYRAGHYPEAIDRLLEADRVMPNAAYSYNIALVYQAMNDNRSALRWLRSYLRQSSDKDVKAETKVRALETELQRKGLQQVTVLSKPPGATLHIDGAVLGITPFTTEIAPGSHYATLSLDGYKAAQQSFELRPDRSIDVEITLAPTAAQPVAPSPNSTLAPAAVPVSAQPAPVHVLSLSSTQPFPTDSVRASQSVRPLTWATLGVGVILAGGNVYFEFARARAEQEARDASQADFQADYDRMKSRQTAARVLAIAGGAVLTTGLVLLTVDLTRRGPTKTADVRGCGSAGLCASFGGHF